MATVVLCGSHACLGEITKVIVEPLYKLPHHSAVEVTPGLISLSPVGSTCRIPVELTNNSLPPVTLPLKPILAFLQGASEVCETQSKSEACEKVSIDLSATTLRPKQETKSRRY